MTDESKGYPKFQWSKFVGANRDQQIVVRAEKWTHITKGIEKAMEYAEKVEEGPIEVSDPTDKFVGSGTANAPDANPKCEVCGQPMEYKTGTSKAGKTWKGFFCTSGEKHPVKWV
jgi:hypothetical protein